MARDIQKKMVYAWEGRVVRPRGGAVIPYANAQGVVTAVWSCAGLMHPPRVVPMPKQDKTAFAKANRTDVWLPEQTPTWVILHEVAHSMAGTFDGESDAHGPDYLWLYMTLIDRHLKIPMIELMATAKMAGLKFTLGAKPMFLDKAS